MTPADDDKTAHQPRPVSGFAPTNFQPTAAAERTSIIPPPGARPPDMGNGLPIGTRIGEFELTSMIGEGGFGIVYLANDLSLGRRVALKEYMPSSLAMRTAESGVQVKSERYLETFEAGRKSFVNEARLLAQFDHPSLVKVYRFWESNGTAYMVMPFYEGKNLKDTLRENLAATGQPPSESWLRALLLPLSEALRVIHLEQCYHRDIAPDNVMMLAGSQRPLLLDFGAARRVIGDMTQALTVILKPGYAPIEQYAEIPGMRQGPWTDVYALAAVVYYAITGKTPPVSVGRMLNDNFQPLAQVAAGRYSAQFLEAVDRALVVRPEQRTQSIEAFRDDLGLMEPGTLAGGTTVMRAAALEATRIVPAGPGEGAAPGGAGGKADAPQAPREAPRAVPPQAQPHPQPTPAPPRRPAPAEHEATIVAPRATPAPSLAPARPQRAPVPAPMVFPTSGDESSSSRRGLLVGVGAAVVAALGIGGYLMTRGKGGSTVAVGPAPAPAPTTPPQAPSAPAAPVASPAAAPTPAEPTPAAPVPAPAPAATAAFDAAREFDKVVAAQSAAFGVNASAPKATLRIGADSFKFSVQSARAGHLYVLGTDASGTLAQLVPNRRSGPVRLRAGQTWQFPAKDDFVLDAADPPGVSQFLIVVSAEPRNFDALEPKAEGDIRLFAAGTKAQAAVAAFAGAGSALGGKAVCPAGAAKCDESYGAAVLKFNVVR